ncbi:hypothetical protein [Nevskia soli]|uniref:hypothetical protein n=1 Tax=Nevskia soli TaxID=418856 RepID=UPI0004A6AB90|nr:hypothetical protein [Nevskia soli]
MALTIPCQNTNVVSLGDFIEHVSSTVDCKDPESVASVAPMLRALANDRHLVLLALHQQMRDLFSNQRVPTTQVVVLGGGMDFYVRADIWPAAEAAGSPTYREQAAIYNCGTGQSFPCLMTGHFGPGLINDLYAYDPAAIIGYPGEPVPLTFVERVRLSVDQAVMFLPHGEVVHRLPPEKLSISVALMILHEIGDQHMVDMKTATLRDYAPELPSSRRSAMLRLAGLIGDGNTQQLLDDLIVASPCPRTRLAAYEALSKLVPERTTALWERASGDTDALVSHLASHKISGLTNG